LSNPVPWQNWMVAYLGYTLRMRTLFRGWPIMVNDTHTRRRRLMIAVDVLLQNFPRLARSWTQFSIFLTDIEPVKSITVSSWKLSDLNVRYILSFFLYFFIFVICILSFFLYFFIYFFFFSLQEGTCPLHVPALRPASQADPMRSPKGGKSGPFHFVAYNVYTTYIVKISITYLQYLKH